LEYLATDPTLEKSITTDCKASIFLCNDTAAAVKELLSAQKEKCEKIEWHDKG
jgi:hypothetical protein